MYSILLSFVLFTLNANQQYEKVLDIVNKIPNKQMSAERYFYAATAAYNMIDKKLTLQYLDKFDDFFNKRFTHEYIGKLMRDEAIKWKDDDLHEASRLAANAARRLEQYKANGRTQKDQKKIVDILDKMIKKMEDDMEAARQQAIADAAARMPNPNPIQGSPQDDSHIGLNKGPGKIEEKRLREYAEVWGTLGPKERAAAMMELTKDLPPKYREIIENYSKSISKTPTKSQIKK